MIHRIFSYAKSHKERFPVGIICTSNGASGNTKGKDKAVQNLPKQFHCLCVWIAIWEIYLPATLLWRKFWQQA